MSISSNAKSYPLLQGANAIITGGVQGLGYAIARRFAECGARLFLFDLQGEKAEEAARQLPGQNHVAIQCDITDPAQREQAIGRTVGIGQRIDILVNNAGIQYHSPLENIEADKWYRLVEVNLNAILFMSQAVGKVMISQHSGCIINISSIAGLVGMPRHAPYVTAKTGLLGLTRALAVEWAGHGIRANAICPGYFATPMLQEYIERGMISEREIVRHIPMGKLGSLDAVGDGAVFLASPLAEYITGYTLVIDGGWTAFGAPEDAS
jgi:NAD(P)-dependent dehydrogenase (short-subunit alcohol dehydrogenase family)